MSKSPKQVAEFLSKKHTERWTLPMKAPQRIRIDGHVRAGFEAVRDAFAENFSRRHELGGACCVYHQGEKVVDLWGGVWTGA